MSESSPRIGLFVTCLVDLFRPNIGFSALELLQRAGCTVAVPTSQVCCGQPGFNSGDERTAATIARQLIAAFEPYDYLVAPSGSCVGMIRQHYAQMFETDLGWRARAEALAGRSFELMEFLVDVMHFAGADARYDGNVTYHDSCTGLRELGVRRQPRTLLAQVAGLNCREMPNSDICCGFGGTFCVKYPEVSTRLATDKVASVDATGADTLLGGDLGCLLNIAGRLSRQGKAVKVYHVAEVLAGRAGGAAIGEPD